MEQNRLSNSKLNGKYYSQKDRKIFNLATIAGAYDHNLAKCIFSVCINEIQSKENIDIGYTDHMYNNQLYFVNYKIVYCSTIIQSTKKVLSTI